MEFSKENYQNQLQAMREEHEALKKYCQEQIAILEEENRRIKEKISELRQEHDEVVKAVLPNRIKNKQRNTFAMDLTAFPLPEELLKILNEAPVKIVDVGAFELEGQEDLYSDLFIRYRSEVIGFEPQNDCIVSKNNKKCLKTVLPWAIGDGQRVRFYKTKYPAASSTFAPNSDLVEKFLALPTMLEVEQESEIDTRRLDDIEEITGCDLLKVDVQGGELKVLQGAKKLLQQVSIIMTEVEFSPIYMNQPLFSDIDSFLRDQGFFLLNLSNRSYSSFKVSLFSDLKSQLMWADAVYVKEPAELEKSSPKKILMAVLIAHVILRDPSLTAFSSGGV